MRWLGLLAALLACESRKVDQPFTLRVALTSPLLPISSEIAETSSSGVAQSWVFEPLATFDETGQLVPRLARSVEYAGARKLRVRLRPATFSDGAPVTEADVIRSLAASRLRAVPVDGALEIDTDDRYTPLEWLLVAAPVARLGPDGEIGSGPFMVSRQTADSILLTRRSAARGAINAVELRGFPSRRDTFVRTLRGDADLLQIPEPRDLEFFEGVPRLRVLRGASPGVHAVAFNPRRLDRAERAALVRALPAAALSSVSYGEGCAAIPPREPFAPLPPGRKLDILVPRGYDEKLGLAVRRALGDRGGELRVLELGPYFEAIKRGDFDLTTARPRTWPPLSAATLWRTGSSNNYIGYSNPRVDAALDAGDWAAAQRELLEDPPAAFLCTQQRLAVVDARVEDARLGPYGLFETLPEWRVHP